MAWLPPGHPELHEQQRQQCLGDLIEPEHLSMQLQPEATLHEAGGEVSSHGANRDTYSDAPLETEDQSHDRGEAHRHHQATNGFRGPEHGLSVTQLAPAIKRRAEALVEQLRGQYGAPVRDAKQEQNAQE
jgi:hypothetical protein